MKRRAKYNFIGVRKAGCGCFYFFAAILLLAGVWIWWITHKAPASRKPTRTITTGTGVRRMIQLTNATAATRTNPVAPVPPRPVPPPVVVTNVAPVTPPPPLATNRATPVEPSANLRAGLPVLEAQVALARLAISPGSIDGLMGTQTRSALRAYQLNQRLPVTGELDNATRTALALSVPLYTNYIVTSNDLARLQPIRPTWLGKSQQSALDYETILELVAEKGRAYPSLIRRLNPGVNWTNVQPGTVVQLPDVADPDAPAKAAFIRISLSGKVLEALDAKTNLLAHFPCSIAQRVEKRPVGELRVVVIAPNPDYTFDPDVFPESEEARRLKTRIVLPPGPNNPVGVAWIGLDRPGYGMHGTPNPEQVGRTESHGCFRLANWNAEFLVKLVWIGMPVYVEP